MEHDPRRLYRGPAGVLAEPLVRRLRGRGLSQHKAAWWAHRAVWRLTRSNRVLLDGFDLETDLHDSLQLARGVYEPVEAAWYREHVRPGDRVLELGANIGYFTCLFARLTGESGRVVAYEPDPRLRAICERNLARNEVAGWAQAREAAVSDHAGQATFYRAGRNYGNNSLFRDTRDALRGTDIEVSLVTVDEDLAGEGFDFVKMDIQGGEVDALRGMRQLLASAPPRLMLVEFWPTGLAGLGHDPHELLDLVSGAGYAVSELVGAGYSPPGAEPGSEVAVDVDELCRRVTPENQWWTNLVCRRRGDAQP